MEIFMMKNTHHCDAPIKVNNKNYNKELMDYTAGVYMSAEKRDKDGKNTMVLAKWSLPSKVSADNWFVKVVEIARMVSKLPNDQIFVARCLGEHNPKMVDIRIGLGCSREEFLEINNIDTNTILRVR